MSGHTKGRLVVIEHYDGVKQSANENDQIALVIDGDMGNTVVWAGNGDTYYNSCGYLELPDARRLAACWNACIGFETESLENVLMLGDTMHSRFAALKTECDQAHRELDAARALLREVYEEGNLDMGDQVSKELDNRISSYIDACDTLEGAPNAG